MSTPGTPASRRYQSTYAPQSTASRHRRKRLLLLLGLLGLIVLLTCIIVPPSVVLTRKSNVRAADQGQLYTTVVDGRTSTITRGGGIATRSQLTTLAIGEVSTITSVVALPVVTVSATNVQDVQTAYVTSTLTDGLVIVLETATRVQTAVATVTYTAQNATWLADDLNFFAEYLDKLERDCSGVADIALAVHLDSDFARTDLALVGAVESVHNHALLRIDDYATVEHDDAYYAASQLVHVGRVDQQLAGSSPAARELCDVYQLADNLELDFRIEHLYVELVLEQLARVDHLAGSEHLKLAARLVDDRSALDLVPHVKLVDQLVQHDSADLQLPRPPDRLHARLDAAAAAEQHEHVERRHHDHGHDDEPRINVEQLDLGNNNEPSTTSATITAPPSSSSASTSSAVSTSSSSTSAVSCIFFGLPLGCVPGSTSTTTSTVSSTGASNTTVPSSTSSSPGSTSAPSFSIPSTSTSSSANPSVTIPPIECLGIDRYLVVGVGGVLKHDSSSAYFFLLDGRLQRLELLSHDLELILVDHDKRYHAAPDRAFHLDGLADKYTLEFYDDDYARSR
ncbi:hypothetical protein JCM9279_007352 [Rhodotorula babjevae]